MADYAATFLHVNWIDVARYVLNRTEQYKSNQAAYGVRRDVRTVERELGELLLFISAMLNVFEVSVCWKFTSVVLALERDCEKYFPTELSVKTLPSPVILLGFEWMKVVLVRNPVSTITTAFNRCLTNLSIILWPVCLLLPTWLEEHGLS